MNLGINGMKTGDQTEEISLVFRSRYGISEHRPKAMTGYEQEYKNGNG